MKVTELQNIIQSGGGNYSNGKLAEYNKGYMVSVEDILKVNIKSVSLVNLSKIIGYIVKEYKYKNLGFWMDNNMLYIDKSVNIPNLEDAVKIGVSNKQLAIWDCNLNESITL